jgi:hypothetical protein
MALQNDQDHPAGWIKPRRTPTLAELEALIEEKRTELLLLEQQASSLRHETKLQALAQARNIMRAHGLTLADLSLGQGRPPSPFDR